jgi:RNA polymerase sigma factor (sigma-70 family)
LLKIQAFSTGAAALIHVGYTIENMRPRHSILELFSTFLQFAGNSDGGWIVDAKLRRSMQACLEQAPQPEVSDSFWALYWHKFWQTEHSQLAANHLTAYLQEVCYWSARKLALNLSHGESIADFFQIAIAQSNRVLKGFDPQQGSELKRYASLAFSNIIKDTLRMRQEVEICTDWALLHRVSRKRLTEALQQFGLISLGVDGHVLAWQCFQALYGPTEAKSTRKLAKPSLETLVQISQLYNQQRSSIHPSLEKADSGLIEQWLVACGKAVRSYLYPHLVSADAQPDPEGSSFLDQFESTFQDATLASVIEQEEEHQRRNQRYQVNAVLLRALVKLDLASQRLLQAYYGEGLTQQQIAQQFDLKQYTVSRRLTSIRQALLRSLGEWSRTILHQSLDSDVLNSMSLVLEDWLKVHYNHPDLPAQP